MGLSKLISAVLGAAATQATDELASSRPGPGSARTRGARAEEPRTPARRELVIAFPAQSARAALLDESVVKAQERARLVEDATRS